MRKSTYKNIIWSKVHVGTSPVITMELFFSYFENEFPEPKNTPISKIWLLFILHGIWHKCTIDIWEIFLFFPPLLCVCLSVHPKVFSVHAPLVSTAFAIVLAWVLVLSYSITGAFVSKSRIASFAKYSRRRKNTENLVRAGHLTQVGHTHHLLWSQRPHFSQVFRL